MPRRKIDDVAQLPVEAELKAQPRYAALHSRAAGREIKLR